MIVSNLSSGAEACIKIMELDSGQAETVRSCILNYTLPESFCEKLRWLVYRIVQAFKSIFGISDWQTISCMIESHYMQNAINRKIVQQNPENVLERKIKEKAINFFEINVQELLSITLLVHEEKQDDNAEFTNRLNKLSLNEALSEFNLVKQTIVSRLAAEEMVENSLKKAIKEV